MIAKDLAKREIQDLSEGRVLIAAQFRKRCEQILALYGEPKPGIGRSSLENLVAGMPKRLQKGIDNHYGRRGT